MGANVHFTKQFVIQIIRVPTNEWKVISSDAFVGQWLDHTHGEVPLIDNDEVATALFGELKLIATWSELFMIKWN